jgi:hypothetical protein
MTMTTLPIHAPALPKLWTLPTAAFRRAVHVLKVFAEVYAEAQQQAREAEKRYPFAGW